MSQFQRKIENKDSKFTNSFLDINQKHTENYNQSMNLSINNNNFDKKNINNSNINNAYSIFTKSNSNNNNNNFNNSQNKISMNQGPFFQDSLNSSNKSIQRKESDPRNIWKNNQNLNLINKNSLNSDENKKSQIINNDPKSIFSSNKNICKLNILILFSYFISFYFI
jgi:hypothetical protein